MKRNIGVAAIVALVASASVAPGAFAQCGGGMLIKFDADCFAYETNYNSLTGGSPRGSQLGSDLNVVGLITQFCAPFDDQVPNLPAKEYSFLWTGMKSLGSVEGPYAATGTRWDTDYTAGTFHIYENAPADAPRDGGMPASPPNLTVPSNFINGTLILEGTMSGLHTIVSRSSNLPSAIWLGSFIANYNFTGGSLYHRVAGTGQGFMQGLWCAKPGTGCVPTGYSAHPSGKWDVPVTNAQSSTWGSIKKLYR